MKNQVNSKYQQKPYKCSEMSLKIALILSVVFQFLTAIIALTLVKRTRANIAWWLISLGFLLMAIRRLFELFQVFNTQDAMINSLTNSWLGVMISILMLLSLAFIKRIFNIQNRLDKLKKDNEAKVFSAIIRTEEEQKYRFSKELHDGLGPLLSSVKMAISSVLKNVTLGKEGKVLSNAEYLMDESIKTIKEISNNLSPHVLMNFGLLKAIHAFVNKLTGSSETQINIQSNIGSKRYEHTIEAVVYRVICELVTNTLKHADANNIFIDIIEDDKTINIKYMDDGKGFDYSPYEMKSNGFGLTNILSRVKSVHGSSQFYSKQGEGFNANFVINL